MDSGERMKYRHTVVISLDDERAEESNQKNRLSELQDMHEGRKSGRHYLVTRWLRSALDTFSIWIRRKITPVQILTYGRYLDGHIPEEKRTPKFEIA